MYIAIFRAMHVFAKMENPLGPRLPPKGFSISRVITRIIGAIQKNNALRGSPSLRHHDNRGPPMYIHMYTYSDMYSIDRAICKIT